MDTDLIDLMTKWRHTLHSHPETAFEEVATADLVAAVLRDHGFEVHHGVGRTGVVGTMTRSAGPAIGLRADMDALPIAEANDFSHRSRHEGKMHACGHDGHTAMLLGAAVALSRDLDWCGTVNVIFQPAEEGPAGGGKVMVEDGLFERFSCDAVFGLHNWPGFPRGHFAINDGPMMASFDAFEIIVDGKGSHAAMPEEGSDVLVCASQIVVALQTIISRRISPKESGVVSVTQILGGDAWNVLPDRAIIRGTVRCFTSAVQERIRASIGEIATGIAHALAVNATLDYRCAYPATINNPAQADLAAAAAEATVGVSSVRRGCTPSMASEDFAFMLKAKPGAYIWMGVDEEAPAAPLHNPHYDFNDAALEIGARYWVNLVKLFGTRSSSTL